VNKVKILQPGRARRAYILLEIDLDVVCLARNQFRIFFHKGVFLIVMDFAGLTCLWIWIQ
jgi:hypothetical protein